MAKYKVIFKKSVAKDLRSIPNRDVKYILDKIDSISENPFAHGSAKLSSFELYRTRQGINRIVYEIRDQTLAINVIRIGHGPNVYKRNRVA